MIDAMYGDEDPVIGWMRASPAPRLIAFRRGTLLATESVADQLPRQWDSIGPPT